MSPKVPGGSFETSCVKCPPYHTTTSAPLIASPVNQESIPASYGGPTAETPSSISEDRYRRIQTSPRAKGQSDSAVATPSSGPGMMSYASPVDLLATRHLRWRIG